MRFILALLLTLFTMTSYAEKNTTDEMILKSIDAMKRVSQNQDYVLIYHKLDAYIESGIKENWLLNYYAALARVFQATDERMKDQSTVPQLLNDADLQLKKALRIQKVDEIYILQAYIRIIKMKQNAKDGYKLYGNEISNLLSEVRTLGGSNPRLKLMEGLFLFYTPDDMSDGKDRVRDTLNEAKNLFNNSGEMKYINGPTWGANLVETYLHLF